MPDVAHEWLATLERLETIGLDELVSRADLQVRQDRKYLVAPEVLGAVLDDLASEVRALEIEGSRAFGYESVYFDTPDLRSYLDAARR